jgi:potassium/hydrogen antiporter
VLGFVWEDHATGFVMDSLTAYLIAISLALIVSVALSKWAGRFGIPGLLIFLVIGMLAGRGGPGGFPFSNYVVAQTFGILALICILHAGGLGTTVADVRLVRGSGLVLSTLGTVIATMLVAAFSVRVLRMSPLMGFLLGATVASTDVAAVFTILRARSVSLRGRIRPLLEIESALNDPMAVFLSIGALSLITRSDASLLRLIPAFVLQMIVGTLAGFAGAKATQWALNHARLEFEGVVPRAERRAPCADLRRHAGAWR